MLEHLADAAREAGVTTFTADALAENHDVLAVFRDLGLRVIRRFDGPEVHCLVDLTEDEDYLRAVDTRARLADIASLRPLLRPTKVAVIGAGRRPGSVGRTLLGNICAGSFNGHVFAVQPDLTSVLAVPAYPKVSALPETPDVAVIAVPAPSVTEVAEECGEAGVKALIVISAGLDAHQAGALMGSCRRHGMRLVGPNCLGLANTEEEHASTPPSPRTDRMPEQPASRCSPVG